MESIQVKHRPERQCCFSSLLFLIGSRHFQHARNWTTTDTLSTMTPHEISTLALSAAGVLLSIAGIWAALHVWRHPRSPHSNDPPYDLRGLEDLRDQLRRTEDGIRQDARRDHLIAELRAAIAETRQIAADAGVLDSLAVAPDATAGQ
jgi:hypothetical protein